MGCPYAEQLRIIRGLESIIDNNGEIWYPGDRCWSSIRGWIGNIVFIPDESEPLRQFMEQSCHDHTVVVVRFDGYIDEEPFNVEYPLECLTKVDTDGQ